MTRVGITPSIQYAGQRITPAEAHPFVNKAAKVFAEHDGAFLQPFRHKTLLTVTGIPARSSEIEITDPERSKSHVSIPPQQSGVIAQATHEFRNDYGLYAHNPVEVHIARLREQTWHKPDYNGITRLISLGSATVHMQEFYGEPLGPEGLEWNGFHHTPIEPPKDGWNSVSLEQGQAIDIVGPHPEGTLHNIEAGAVNFFVSLHFVPEN